MLRSPLSRRENNVSGRNSRFVNGCDKYKGVYGFMLLEAVLSVFIVTIGVVFVISSFMTSIKTFKTSKIYLDILYLMEEKMWEYEEKGKIEEGSDSGDFEAYKNAEWNIEAEEIEDLPLNETAVEIVLKEDDRKRRFKIVTYFYNEK